jgi:hypothetical protein
MNSFRVDTQAFLPSSGDSRQAVQELLILAMHLYTIAGIHMEPYSMIKPLIIVPLLPSENGTAR